MKEINQQVLDRYKELRTHLTRTRKIRIGLQKVDAKPEWPTSYEKQFQACFVHLVTAGKLVIVVQSEKDPRHTTIYEKPCNP